MTPGFDNQALALQAIYGGTDLLQGSETACYSHDQSRVAAEAAAAVVFPVEHQQIVDTVNWARFHNVVLVPSGGRTGLSGGAVANRDSVVLSLDRMNRLLDFDRENGEITVEAGMTIARLQQLAAEAGWFYPVDYASRDTAQVGGALACNAGGIRVLRYGMTRDQVLGLTAITGSGEILSIDRRLIKDNAGYDLKNLLIGSEGTLAIITSATFKLASPMPEQTTVLMAFDDLPSLLKVFSSLKRYGNLSAAEFFCDNCMDIVGRLHNMTSPFSGRHMFYLLLEYDHDSITDDRLLQTAEGADCVLAHNQRQAQTLWQWREKISTSIHPMQPYKQDLACHVYCLTDWLSDLQQSVSAIDKNLQLLLFGHIGDGNVHVNIVQGDGGVPECPEAELDQLLAKLCRRYNGTVSAEHGIGLLKKPLLTAARTEQELALYGQIKKVFDPGNILNRGKLLG